MIERLRQLLYRGGILRRFQDVDDLRYLRRLRSSKSSDRGNYVSDKDRAQYLAGEDVAVRFSFAGRHCILTANPDSHVEANLLRDPRRAMQLAELLSSYCRDGSFIDVGANIGLFSIPLALAHPGLGVKAFEPNPAAIQRMASNIALNGNPPNLELLPIGLGQETGNFTLYGFSGKDLGQSSLLPPANCSEAPQEITIPVKRLDDVLQGAERRVDAIKIDVQGIELAVLKGAVETLSKHRPVVLFEHEDLNFADERQAVLAKHGLRDLLAEMRYRAFYVSKKSPSLLFPANWDARLNGDLLAVPV